MSSPSRTSQAVALTRAGLDRPHSPQGDPSAQRALCADMGFEPPAWMAPSIAARTQFVDGQVSSAIGAGIAQVVICGAGYDDRALRFRTAGVRFLELDHPGTQADKARRVQQLDTAGLTLVSADFTADDVAERLAQAGHDRLQPSLFVCEGLLVYLDQATCRRLLSGLASRAAPGSVLAASLATHADGFDSAEVLAVANARRRTAAAEPWLTILPAAEHLQLLAESGWRVSSTQWSPATSAEVTHGRRSLLVAAAPA